MSNSPSNKENPEEQKEEINIFKIDMVNLEQISESRIEDKIEENISNIQINRENFVCTKCQRRFWKKQSFENHNQAHEEGKIYICENCGKSYPKMARLKIHQRVHVNLLEWEKALLLYI